MAKEDDGGMGSWSVSRIISSIKGAFREKDFAMVEDVLVTREDNLRAEIKKLREENMVLKKDSERKDQEIISLRREKFEIEVSKAEALAKAKAKYESLDKTVLLLEETKLLANSEALGDGTTVEADDNEVKMEKVAEKVIDAIKKSGFDVGSGPNGKLISKESNGDNEAKCNQAKVEITKEKVTKAELVEETKEHKAPNDVIEIESDDDCVPSATQNIKEKVGDTVSDNNMLKRKRASGGYLIESSDEIHIDGNTSSGKDKMKLQTPTHKPENAVSHGNNGSENVSKPSSAKQGSESARQCEEKVVSVAAYPNIHSGDFDFGSDSSDSSESESDDDDYFVNLDKILSSQAI